MTRVPDSRYTVSFTRVDQLTGPVATIFDAGTTEISVCTSAEPLPPKSKARTRKRTSVGSETLGSVIAGVLEAKAVTDPEAAYAVANGVVSPSR